MTLDYFGALNSCYFDATGFSTPKQIHDIKIDIPTSHFLYGSDCPYTPSFACIALAGSLEKCADLTSHPRINKVKRNVLGTGIDAFSNHNHQK